MELIIDIPDRIYKINQNRRLNITDSEILEKAVRNGTPLDDVKAEIREHCERYIDGDIIADEVIQAVDNIGKESEDKE